MAATFVYLPDRKLWINLLHVTDVKDGVDRFGCPEVNVYLSVATNRDDCSVHLQECYTLQGEERETFLAHLKTFTFTPIK